MNVLPQSKFLKNADNKVVTSLKKKKVVVWAVFLSGLVWFRV